MRASFEASGGAYGPESVTADLRRGPGEPVSWRALAPGDAETPVVASEKVVRRIMREEGLVARKAAQMRRRARYCSYRGELAERPANVPLRGDGTHDFRAAAPGLLVVTDVTEFRLDGYRAYLSPAIDCFDGWPICWRVSVHADSDLMVGMLRDLVGIVGPTEGRPLTVHTDGGAVYMGREWREACGPGVVRSMSRRARSPDNARAEGFFGTLKCDFFEGRDWTGVPFDEFSRLLGEYIEWYRDGKLKKDLGWKTIREYREERAMRHSAGAWSGKTSEVPTFPIGSQAETASHSRQEFRDTLSANKEGHLMWPPSCAGLFEQQTFPVPPPAADSGPRPRYLILVVPGARLGSVSLASVWKCSV